MNEITDVNGIVIKILYDPGEIEAIKARDLARARRMWDDIDRMTGSMSAFDILGTRP